MASHHFRAGVVVVVRHPENGMVMAFERVDAPGSWQLPQGGIDEGESPLEAAWRELGEETGLGAEHVAVHSEHPDWIAYEWPDEVRSRKRAAHLRLGQVQKWFVFVALSGDIVPVPDGTEFGAWQWVEPRWLVDNVLEWRRAGYERVLGAL